MEAQRNAQNSLGLTTDHDVYEVRRRKAMDGFDLTSDGFRGGRICYPEPDAVRKAVAYAMYRSLSCSRRAIIRVLDDSGTVIHTHEYEGGFRQWWKHSSS